MIRITKKFTFEAAHIIPGHPKCGKCHGHSWVLKISVDGEINENGMVIDFHDLKSLISAYVIDKMDHKYLNDEFKFTPTCESLVMWIWEQLEEPLKSSGVKLQRVKLAETSDNYASYYGKTNN
jgi:6-pyruvoyltetrahydropterin/6-carboxytetrahydropterin synthase